MSDRPAVNDGSSMRRNHGRLCLVTTPSGREKTSRVGEEGWTRGASPPCTSPPPPPAGQISFVFPVGGWKSDRYTVSPNEERPPILRRTKGDQQTDKDTDNEWDADRLWANSTREITPTTWPQPVYYYSAHCTFPLPEGNRSPSGPWGGGGGGGGMIHPRKFQRGPSSLNDLYAHEKSRGYYYQGSERFSKQSFKHKRNQLNSSDELIGKLNHLYKSVSRQLLISNFNFWKTFVFYLSETSFIFLNSKYKRFSNHIQNNH